jgi:hypothetical protein
MKHPAIDNMQKKWDRLTEVADGGIAGIPVKHTDLKSPFGGAGTASFTINGVPAWDPKEIKKRSL